MARRISKEPGYNVDGSIVKEINQVQEGREIDIGNVKKERSLTHTSNGLEKEGYETIDILFIILQNRNFPENRCQHSALVDNDAIHPLLHLPIRVRLVVERGEVPTPATMKQLKGDVR